MDTRTLDRSPISNFTANGMGILNGNATSFSNVISSIQFACNPYTTSPHSLSFVFLPDEENALALRDCFLQLGLQLPSFLHRVYLLDREFALFSERASTRYPVRSSTDFILHTCNGRDPSYRGLSRCLDIHQALLSLRSRGHHLHPSSQLSLFAPNSLSWSENSRHRHLSMDASRESFSSLFLRSPPNRTSSGASEMSRRSNEATATFPDIHSVTPLLASRALFDGRRIEEDELGDFRLPSSSVDYRRGGMEARLLNSSVDVPSRGSLDATRHSLDMSHNSLDMSHNSLDIPHTSLESPYRPISFAIDPPSTADYPSLGNDSLQSLFTFHTKPVTSSPLLSVHADYARWSDASPNDLLQPWKTPRTGRMAEELETERRRANSISFLSGTSGISGTSNTSGTARIAERTQDVSLQLLPRAVARLLCGRRTGRLLVPDPVLRQRAQRLRAVARLRAARELRLQAGGGRTRLRALSRWSHASQEQSVEIEPEQCGVRAAATDES